jgi:hypothetical protein
LKTFLGLIRPKKSLSLPKMVEKTTIMSIINGLEQNAGHIVLRKHKMAFLKITICRTEMTIERSIFLPQIMKL